MYVDWEYYKIFYFVAKYRTSWRISCTVCYLSAPTGV